MESTIDRHGSQAVDKFFPYGLFPALELDRVEPDGDGFLVHGTLTEDSCRSFCLRIDNLGQIATLRRIKAQIRRQVNANCDPQRRFSERWWDHLGECLMRSGVVRRRGGVS